MMTKYIQNYQHHHHCHCHKSNSHDNVDSVDDGNDENNDDDGDDGESCRLHGELISMLLSECCAFYNISFLCARVLKESTVINVMRIQPQFKVSCWCCCC